MAQPPGLGNPPGPSVQSILILDDEQDILESLRELLLDALEHVEVHAASSGPEALEILAHRKVDLILTDYKMPGMNGLEFLAKAGAVAPGVPRILITAFPDLEIAIKAINEAGIENFITKPFDPAYVINTVQAVLTEQKAQVLRSQSFARSLDMLRKQLQKP